MTLIGLSLSIGGGYGSLVPPLDETPNAFSFTGVTGATVATAYTSNEITVSGLGTDVSVAVSVSGGQYSKNGGAFTGSAGTASNGDTFKLKRNSSAIQDEAVSAILTIGGVSGTFTITTAASAPPLTSVAADGWQATVDSPTDLSLTPVSVSRAGFDATGTATTHADTLYTTKRIRLPYPDQATLTADQVALSDYVYSTDTIAGVTNNSTEASPKPIANWIMPHRLVVGDTVDLEVIAFHRDARAGSQVACVLFSATDGTTTVNQLVASTAVSGRAGDKHPVISYKAALDISTLDPGLITCNAKVYPWLGDAASVADSADSSVAREFSPRYFLRDTTLAAAPPLAYVATTGNDSTGVVSTDPATAKASPFLTVKGAIDGIHTALSATTGIDGAQVRIGNDGGTPFVLGSSVAARAQKCAALTITRDPDVARANARVSLGAASYRPRFGSGGTLLAPLTTGALRLADVGVQRSGALYFQGEAATQLEIIMEDVDWDQNGASTTWLSNAHDYLFGVTFSNFGGANPLAAGTYEHRCIRGVSLGRVGGVNLEQWLIVGCDIDQINGIAVNTRTASGSITAFNRFQSPTTTTCLTLGGSADVENVAIVQNIFEWTAATAGDVIGVSNDNATGNNSHIVIHHNTFVGAFSAGRANLFYDEGDTPRTSKLMSVKGNIFVQINTKSDVMRGANQGGEDASTRTGNWAFEHGVGCAGNFSQWIDAASGGIGSSFAQEYPGLSCDIGASSSAPNDPMFVDDQGTTYNGSTYTAGAGGGDYALQAGSPAIGLLPVAVLSHNLAGDARPTTNDNAGAY